MQAHIAKQLQKFTIRSSTKGFSLPGLLIGGTLSLAVVAAGGYGVARMIDVSTTADAKSERRLELDRAIAFLESETREASAIAQDASDATLVPAEFDPSAAGVSNAERVLMLETASASEPIIYYLGDPADETWGGPKVIYRWGPNFDGAGEYTNATTPANWTHEPLVDKIASNGNTPDCPPNWTGNGAPGFYVCVDPAGKIAQVQQVGQIKKVLARTEAYATDTRMSVRVSDVNAAVFAPDTGAVLAFREDDGTITTGTQSTMRVEIMGGEITCGEGGPDIPTWANLNFDDGNEASTETVSSNAAVYEWENAPKGSTLDVTGVSGSTSGCDDGMQVNSASNSPQVIALKDGDTVPSYVPFDNQGSLDSYLDSITDANGKVSLSSNEVVFIYELGETDTSSPAFDMQDLVVRATITPTVN